MFTLRVATPPVYRCAVTYITEISMDCTYLQILLDFVDDVT